MVNCEFENGNQAHLRHAVVDGVIVKDGQILLVKRAAHLLEGGKWGLPAGYMEFDETVTQALARETKEETGWEIENPVLLMVNSNPNRPGEDRQNVSFGFAATAIQKTGQPDNESTEQGWFSFDNLPAKSELAFDYADLIAFYQLHQDTPQVLPKLV